jgi:hypothetical protein
VSVTGPINNKVVCFGLLAIAHDVIKDFNDGLEKKPAIDIVSGLPDTTKDRRLSFEAPVGGR